MPSRAISSTASAAALDHRLRVLVELERREHPVGDVARVAAARPADPEAHAQELARADALGERAQPVVPASPPPCFAGRARTATRVVVHRDDLLGPEPVRLRGARDRAARDVHELLRAEERERLALGQADLLQEAAVLRPLGVGAVARRQQLGDLEADVVPGRAVAPARVAQAGDQQVHVESEPRVRPGSLLALGSLLPSTSAVLGRSASASGASTGDEPVTVASTRSRSPVSARPSGVATSASLQRVADAEIGDVDVDVVDEARGQTEDHDLVGRLLEHAAVELDARAARRSGSLSRAPRSARRAGSRAGRRA